MVQSTFWNECQFGIFVFQSVMKQHSKIKNSTFKPTIKKKTLPWDKIQKLLLKALQAIIAFSLYSGISLIWCTSDVCRNQNSNFFTPHFLIHRCHYSNYTDQQNYNCMPFIVCCQNILAGVLNAYQYVWGMFCILKMS